MKSDRNLEHLLHCKSQASNTDTHAEFILGLLVACFWKYKQKNPTTTNTQNEGPL